MTSSRRSEEHTSELQSLAYLVCRLLLDPATTETYTLSLHDALPIFGHAPAQYLRRSFPRVVGVLGRGQCRVQAGGGVPLLDPEQGVRARDRQAVVLAHGGADDELEEIGRAHV